MQIEPDTKVVQTHFGSQAGLKTSQVVRTLTSQAKGIQELVVDGFNDLPNACQPATQRFGPANALTALMGRRDQLDVVLCLPAVTWALIGKAVVSHIGAVSRLASTRQTGRRRLASRKQGGGQVLIMRAGSSKAKAGNDSQSRDTQQQMKAFVPANPIAPANIGLTNQPRPCRLASRVTAAVLSSTS